MPPVRNLVSKKSTDLGEYVTCPICSQRLTNSEIGVSSHVRKHIREGKIKPEDNIKYRLQILGRKFVKYN